MAEERQQIIDMHREFGAAWSAGDVERLLALFHDDAVRVGARGDVQHGKAELRGAFLELFSGPFKGATVTMDPGEVRVLSAKIALWQGPMTINLGTDKPAMRGYALDVVEMRDGGWRILETHPKLFPPDSPR